MGSHHDDVTFDGQTRVVMDDATASPPGTGGVSAPYQENIPKAPSIGRRRGGHSQATFGFTDLPGRAVNKEASRHLLDRAATPPAPGGEAFASSPRAPV